MKYLKTYKLFESNNVDTILLDITDILLPINDMDFWSAKVKKLPKRFDDNDYLIRVTLRLKELDDEEYSREGQTPNDDVVDTLERVIEYMKINGYEGHGVWLGDTVGGDDRKIDIEQVGELDLWPDEIVFLQFWIIE